MKVFLFNQIIDYLTCLRIGSLDECNTKQKCLWQ